MCVNRNKKLNQYQMKYLVHCIIIQILFISLCSSQEIVFNEIVASNNSSYADRFDEYNDWIELKNFSSDTIDITGFWLSDNLADLYKWGIPNLKIAPNQFELIFCSGKNIIDKGSESNWETIIDVGSEWKYAIHGGDYDITSNWREISATLNWPQGQSGFGYGDGDDNTLVQPTNGLAIRKLFFIETTEDIVSMMLHIDYDDGFIAFINGVEIARDNVCCDYPPLSQLADGDREAEMYQGGLPAEFNLENWEEIINDGYNILAIQIHNSSETSSDLTAIPYLSIAHHNNDSSYYVSPSLASQLLPESSGHYHTNFKLDGDGEEIVLSNQTGVIIDSLSFQEIPIDISYGRHINSFDDWVYFTNPTPMGENSSTAYWGITNSPILNIQGGFVPLGTTIDLQTSNNNIQIYYTTNGSIPTMQSELFNGFTINANSTLRFRAFRDGYFPSKIITHTYFEDLELRTLPVISLVSDSNYFFGNDSGIYVLGDEAVGDFPFFGANWWSDCPHSNMREYGCEDWEHPVHIELYEPNGSLGFNLDAGMRIHGHWMRGLPQKTIAIIARNKYGSNKIEHQIFPNLEINKFKSILLRPSGNDWSSTMIRDGLGAMIAKEIDLDYQEHRQAVVFINGEYWGIHNIREKISEHFISSHHDIDINNLDLVENSYGTWANFGTTDNWFELRSYLIENDMSIDENYQIVEDWIDMQEWINYLVVELYAGNNDWRGGNYKRWYEQNNKWRFILQDLDAGFNQYPEEYNPPEENIFENNALNGSFHEYNNLMLNPKFQNQFINTFADLFNSFLKPDFFISIIDSLQQTIAEEMPLHIEKWANTCSYCPANWIGDGINSMEEWNEELDRLYEFATIRYEVGWDNIINEFDLEGTVDLLLSENQGYGKIKINSIIPIEYPWQGKYFKGNSIILQPIPNQGFEFFKWILNDQTIIYEDYLELPLMGQNNENFSEISVEAIFQVINSSAGSIVINEINYNSSDQYDSEDWIELINNSDSIINISNWIIKDNNSSHIFEIPSTEELSPGDFLIISKDSIMFMNIYPNIENLIGDLGFGLSGSGDMVRLYDNSGSIIDSVNYGVDDPWPSNTDGNGFSLELINPSLNNEFVNAWSSSATHGTPGQQNSAFEYLSSDDDYLPNQISIGQSYPNPFNLSINIPIESHSNNRLSLFIYDVLGRKIFEDEYFIIRGNNIITWTGKTKFGNDISSGIYFVQALWSTGNDTKKIICIK